MFHNLKPRKVLRAKSEFYIKCEIGLVCSSALFLFCYTIIKPKLKPSIYITKDEEESNIINSYSKKSHPFLQLWKILGISVCSGIIIISLKKYTAHCLQLNQERKYRIDYYS